MLKKFRNTIVTLIATFSLVAPLAMPAIVHAASTDLQNSLGCGTNLTLSSTNTPCASGGTDSETTVNSTITKGLNLFSAIVGIISVVMIIVGGIRYITSGGDSGKVSAAQNTVLYAVIGLVVVALAQIVVQFVLKKFTTNT